MIRVFVAAAMVLTLAGCQSAGKTPIDTVDQLDLDRFMGDWYVIAHIPTFPERNAYNAVESYELEEDGRVATTFTFRNGGFDGPVKTLNPTGFVREGTGNAVWGMQFIWPFKAEYRVVHLDPKYERTIIGRTSRDYAWLMARDPDMDEQTFGAMMTLLSDMGYDTSEVRRVPQRWPDAAVLDDSNRDKAQ